MHKNTGLLSYQRREAYRRWLQGEGEKVTVLSKHFGVSRQTFCEVFRKARLEEWLRVAVDDHSRWLYANIFHYRRRFPRRFI